MIKLFRLQHENLEEKSVADVEDSRMGVVRYMVDVK